jgi:hypothetical protein
VGWGRGWLKEKNRETRDGWPLLTVEFGASAGTYGVKKLKWSFLGWFIGLVVTVQEIFILPWML